MVSKKFQKNNQEFDCINCELHVPKHPKSSRDHCIHCLYGLHVDVNPGDRKNTCRGVLIPIGVELKNNDERIVYKCEKCGSKVKCVKAPDDSTEEVLKLYQKIWN